MSGERVVLAGDADAARLVRAAAQLARAGLGPHALIGGLAVMCRLAAVHRATHDVDTVTETTAPTAVQVITSSIGTADPANPTRVLIDGVKIDLIDTESLRSEDLDGIDPHDRLFVVSHRWALDTATETDIVAGEHTASIRVATPSALVAMKSGAVLGGRRREPRKRASDLYDLYRLVIEYDRAGGIAVTLASAPMGLGPLVADALRDRVTDEPERAIRWLLDGGPEMATVTADDLRDALDPLVEHLTS
ncbi:MAG: nucleotidyl transferase AbiEii/AbiGii toxin family protein [Acidimicrobiales bacterium]|nr:nucleotidyl transferase AbiEii/AbiGii toxin family protein [Acidimicrobiales bacterium]